MRFPIKTQFEFTTPRFNCSTPHPYFINECCYGDDVCRWLIQEFQQRDCNTSSEPQQEDFGWFFDVIIADIPHCIVIGFQPNDEAAGDCWIRSIERSVGFWKSILGRRKRNIDPEVGEIIDAILKSEPSISNISWNSQ